MIRHQVADRFSTFASKVVEMRQLADAWSHWWDGAQVGALPLFGKNVLFWGRLGKLLQFAAGLVVVLDIVGTDRLDRIRDQLREWLTRLSRLIGKLTWTSWWMDEGGPWRRWVSMVGYYVLYVAILASAIHYADVRRQIVIEHGLLALFGILFLAVTSVALIGQALLALGYLLAAGMAFLFGGSKPGHVARWLALLLFVLGFHFDLLAS